MFIKLKLNYLIQFQITDLNEVLKKKFNEISMRF